MALVISHTDSACLWLFSLQKQLEKELVQTAKWKMFSIITCKWNPLKQLTSNHFEDFRAATMKSLLELTLAPEKCAESHCGPHEKFVSRPWSHHQIPMNENDTLLNWTLNTVMMIKTFHDLWLREWGVVGVLCLCVLHRGTMCAAFRLCFPPWMSSL